MKMSSLRKTRYALLEAYDDGYLSDDEFMLLYDANKSRDDYAYWSYERFDLDKMENAESWSQFRFYKRDIFRLAEVLQIPDTVQTYNRMLVDGVEALCIALKRFSYPCRYVDMVPYFGRAVPDYSVITNEIMDHVYTTFSHLLDDFNVPFLTTNKLEEYCTAIHNKGAPLDNCFGFVDGTVRPICRPGRDQRVVYNGHKKVHALKFQSIALPNGLIANMYGPLEGRRHDCYMLAKSGLLPKLQQYAFDSNRRSLCIYGDPAYPLRVHLQSGFKNAINPNEREFNTRMSKVRVSVEWLFSDISNWFAFIDFKKNLKIDLSAVGKMYLFCTLLTNARTCTYGNMTSDYFDCEPPTLEEYFS